ncbi:osmotic avoidance abnormal protein 3 isoform X2 [Nilaparvata lugens]|uniref:osmotic avoidance abnormal protein 3 isoform X2 n=1 Tax=Nilaparvata lugens TaxID=108931 RepID=UPI00193E5922|nr:osmotic avoidance abnormal protein 3 isoform X2 [Nilaparvata lugens]
MAECVQVIVRCRPMNSRELSLNCKNVVLMDSERCTCSLVNPNDCSAPPKVFTFDGVYYIDSTTEQIYNEIAYPLIEGVLEGYNSTVFAYGQTGCGKSFSMQGVKDPAAQRGIIPRAFEHIFEAISLVDNVKYLVLASYLEIYNEEIRDLLGNDNKRKLDLKESADRGVYVSDLSHHAVSGVAECQELMEKGWRNRSVGATLMNADSSRSHSIFSISIEMMPFSEHLDASCSIRRGKLSLVDLAGSERQAKTGATGERLKEATKINLSLSALGNVISALVDGKAKHIPYRDSKLTRLLQDSLGGNTKTLMVACLSPADNNYDETLSTLRYANRAKNIQNQPHINEDPKDTMLREYQDEIRKLRDMLENSSDMSQSVPLDDSILQLEREKLRLEYEQEMQALREQYHEMHSTKCQVQADLQALKQQYEGEISRINTQVETKQIPTPRKPVSNDPLDIENPIISPAQQQILKRLQKLQASMVGGERVGDSELRERRLRKKRAAERRLKKLAQILAKVDGEDKGELVLGVYDDIQEELKATLRKHKTKVKGLEREISDLHSEFESERTDYLETIRRQQQQIKLYQQILDKIIPTLKKECNYRDLDKIKSEAEWSEDEQSWILPEISMHTKLPPAGPYVAVATSDGSGSTGRWNKSSGSSDVSNGRQSSTPTDNDNEANAYIFQKLQKSEEEDFAGNYFKPKRATELLIRAQEDASKAFNKWKENNNRISKTGGPSLNSSLNQNGFHSSLNSLHMNPVVAPSNVASAFLNSSWAGSQPSQPNTWLDNNFRISPEFSSRRPLRLEALPMADKKPNQHKSELNTLDVI